VVSMRAWTGRAIRDCPSLSGFVTSYKYFTARIEFQSQLLEAA